MGAVEDWLGEVSLSELHERYPFVDHKWRFLKAIERQIVRLHPDLDDPESHEIRPLGCDLCELRIRVADRSVSISFEGKEPVPRSYFEWDDCRMFRISWSDMDRLATVVHRWVQQRHNPSALQREYFDIKPNPVAHFYESGKPIEGEFLLSWGEMERFYAESRFIQKERALWVIAMVRRSGLDRTLRAGGSLWDLIVSRSRRHGLRPSQPFVAFSFSEALLKLHVHVDGDRVLDLPTSQLNDEQIVGELRRLTLRAID